MKAFRDLVESGDFAGIEALLAEAVVFETFVGDVSLQGLDLADAMAAQFSQIQAEATR